MICGLTIQLLSASQSFETIAFPAGRASVGNGAALLALEAVTDAFGWCVHANAYAPSGFWTLASSQ
jgi:hypothetical protein